MYMYLDIMFLFSLPPCMHMSTCVCMSIYNGECIYLCINVIYTRIYSYTLTQTFNACILQSVEVIHTYTHTHTHTHTRRHVCLILRHAQGDFCSHA